MSVKVVHLFDYTVGAVYMWPTTWRQDYFQGNPPVAYTELEPSEILQGVDTGWRYEGGEFLPPIITPVNYGTKITKLAFLNRLGDSILGAIEAASRVNNTLGYAAAVIKIKHASSTYVDLSLPETESDVQKLVDYGFIDLTKKNEVLNNPVQEKEVPILISNAPN